MPRGTLISLGACVTMARRAGCRADGCKVHQCHPRAHEHRWTDRLQWSSACTRGVQLMAPAWHVHHWHRVQHDASMIVTDPDPANFYCVATLDASYHPARTGELGNHFIGEQPCRWRRRGASPVTTMRGGATKAAIQIPVWGICTHHFSAELLSSGRTPLTF